MTRKEKHSKLDRAASDELMKMLKQQNGNLSSIYFEDNSIKYGNGIRAYGSGFGRTETIDLHFWWGKMTIEVENQPSRRTLKLLERIIRVSNYKL